MPPNDRTRVPKRPSPPKPGRETKATGKPKAKTTAKAPVARENPSEPRRRLSREDAVERILAATEKRLRASGPDSLRIQEIANDVGMSHPTVLHHIGSREELVRAVCSRAIFSLENELLEVFSKQLGPPVIASTLHQIDEVLRHRGQARLIAWLALTQPSEEGDSQSRLGDLVKVLHAAREAPGATFEDTAFAVVLASAAMVGTSLLGPGLFAMAGLPKGEPTLKRFREWFAALMLGHAERVRAEPATAADDP